MLGADIVYLNEEGRRTARHSWHSFERFTAALGSIHRATINNRTLFNDPWHDRCETLDRLIVQVTEPRTFAISFSSIDQPTRCGNTRNASIVSTRGRLAAAGRVQRRHRVIRRIPLFVLHSPGRTISGNRNEVKHAVQLRELWIHRCVAPIVENEPTSTNDRRFAKVTNDRPSASFRARTRPDRTSFAERRRS